MFHVNRYRILEVMRAIRRERIFRNRTNSLEIYDDLELIERFRFDRRTILQITHDLESSTFRNKAIPRLIKVLISLRFFASGSFQIIIYFQQSRIVTFKHTRP
jgi:hypothetical protein